MATYNWSDAEVTLLYNALSEIRNSQASLTRILDGLNILIKDVEKRIDEVETFDDRLSIGLEKLTEFEKRLSNLEKSDEGKGINFVPNQKRKTLWEIIKRQ